VVACFGKKFRTWQHRAQCFCFEKLSPTHSHNRPFRPVHYLSRSFSQHQRARSFRSSTVFVCFFCVPVCFPFIFFVSASRCNLPTALQLTYTHTYVRTVSIYICICTSVRKISGRAVWVCPLSGTYTKVVYMHVYMYIQCSSVRGFYVIQFPAPPSYLLGGRGFGGGPGWRGGGATCNYYLPTERPISSAICVQTFSFTSTFL